MAADNRSCKAHWSKRWNGDEANLWSCCIRGGHVLGGDLVPHGGTGRGQTKLLGKYSLQEKKVSESLRQRESQPAFLATRAMAKVLFADHPYSVTAPTQESIAAATSADLRRASHNASARIKRSGSGRRL